MKKCALVYNPHSGRKLKQNFLVAYIDMLWENGYDTEVYFSKYPGHIIKIISDLSADIDLVITLGGDGTFNEAVNANMSRSQRLLLAHIPIGTTNDIGVMFGYGKDVINNLKLLLSGEIKKIDLCNINGHTFVYVAGFGKFMNVPYETEKSLKNKIGYFAYLLGGLKEFRFGTKLYDLTYEVNGEKYSGLYSFMLISNANRIAGIKKFYKDVKLDDGKFEVLFCNLNRKQDIIKSLFHLATNDITKVPGFYFHKTDYLKIAFKDDVKNWCVDGEKVDTKTKEYEIRVIKDVEIMMPKNKNSNLFENKK